MFSDWEESPYAHLKDLKAPEGVAFTPPIPNVGPDAGGSAEKPLATFEPLSSPGGIVALDDTFGEYAGGFAIPRVGTMVPNAPAETGFDLLFVRMNGDANGGLTATTKLLLKPLARPLDVAIAGPGRIYILEYGRTTSMRARWPANQAPGRVLELRFPKSQP